MEKTKLKGKATHVAKKSPAAKYTTPTLLSVAVEISADEPEFYPVTCPNSHYANVCVLVPTLNHIGVQALRLNHRVTETLDCGFKMKLPAGFRVRAEAVREWSVRGLLVTHAYMEDDSLKLVLTNIGQESPLVIPHKANVAHVWAEPVYFFDWNQK